MIDDVLWETFLNSKCWQRETMVAGTLWNSVVAKMKIVFGGGSSRVLSRALKAVLGDLMDFVDDR